MNLSKKKFKITDWHGNEHYLTAKQLYNRVLSDSKSNYNWIASATELVRVCNEPGFLGNYSREIKVMILNCFANLELNKEYPSRGLSSDKAAVYSCYFSLSNKHENAKQAKEKYLKAIISSVLKYSDGEMRFPLHSGKTYYNLCRDWEKKMFEKYSTENFSDFEKLKSTLRDDFDKTIKEAEKAGAFAEDDAKRREEMKRFWSSLNIGNI